MKKIILSFILTLSITHNILANFETKLSGGFDFASGTLFDKKENDKNNFTFSSKGYLFLNNKYQFDNQNIIGLNINANITAQSTYPSGSYIHFTSDFGKFEFGSTKCAGKKMQITALDLAKSKSWSDFVSLEDKKHKNANFIIGTKLLIDKDSKHNEYSRKISYFSPKILDKIQFGFSYIPDSENIGYASQKTSHEWINNHHMKDGSVAKINSSVKNAFSYGVSFESPLKVGSDLKIVFNGKYGTPTKKAEIKKKDGSIETQLVSDLNSYNMGAIITDGSLSYSASYGNQNKSLTSELIHGMNRDSSWFGFGIAYDQGPVGAAINYYNSDNRGNKISLISFSTDYRISKGLKTYFETSFFNTKIPTEKEDKKTNGTILVLGMKVSF